MAKELIFGIGGHPIMKHDFEQLQSCNSEFMEAISKFIGEDGTFKAFGCVITNGSTTITWTSGTIFYQGKYYRVDAGTLTKSTSPVITFNPFWKIVSNILSPSPVTYETNVQYNVHIENKMVLVEEPEPGDQGIYDAILPQLQGPLLDNLGGGGGTGASLQATFNITNNLGIVSVDANAVNNGEVLSVISGQDIDIIFARTLTTTHARYRIDSGPWISVWGLSGIQPNSKTVTISNVITNKTITIQWLPNNTLYNINRLGSFSNNSTVFVSNQEALKVVNSDGSFYDGNQLKFAVGEKDVAFDFLVLKKISIDYYPYTGTTGRTPDYFVFGTPIISTFKINGVESKTSLGSPVLETYNAELDNLGKPDVVFLTGTGTGHYKYYEYKYLRYRITVPNTPIADITSIQWAYTRDTDDNGYELPETPIGGSGCLQINSLITLSDGSKKELKNISVGDELLSINYGNDFDNTFKIEFTKVLDKQMVGSPKSIILNNGLLHMTESHIQLVERFGKLMLITAKEILKGDYLIGNFNKTKIFSISHYDGNEMFCNIVTENGYYIANDIITHNKTVPPNDPILGG